MDKESRNLIKPIINVIVCIIIIEVIILAMIFNAENSYNKTSDKDATILQLTKKVEFLEKELKASKEKELKLYEEEIKLLEMRNECTKMGYFNK